MTAPSEARGASGISTPQSLGFAPPKADMPTPPSDMPTRPPRADAWLVLALSLAVFLGAHWRGFSTPYAINDDIRQQIYWMQRFQDKDLYPENLLNAYSQAYVPYGVECIYAGAAKMGQLLGAPALSAANGMDFFNPVQFSKILAGLLFVLEALALFHLGAALAGRAGAWGVASMAWLMPFFIDNISGGLARAFASPLLALFLLAVLRANRRQCHCVQFIQACCIPYIYLPCAAGLFAKRAWESWRARLLDRSFTPGGVWWAWAVPVLIAYLNASKPQAGGFGPLVWLSETIGRPEFGPQGRLDLVPLPNPFLDFVYFPFEGVGFFKELGLFPGIASLAALAPILWYGGKNAAWRSLADRLAPLAWTGGAFLVFYAAARMAAFKLFVPDRYVQYPVNLLYAMLLGICLASAVQRLKPGKAVCALLILASATAGAVRLHNVALYDYSDKAALYAAVEAATPKNALLAGHPELMDVVMTFAKRNALATFELAHPWSRGYWQQTAPRLSDFFAAYYARDPETVRAFAQTHNVDFLVVDQSHFTPGFLKGSPFFEPFGKTIRETTQGQEHFAVLDGASFARTGLTPGTFLIDLRAARNAAPEQSAR